MPSVHFKGQTVGLKQANKSIIFQENGNLYCFSQLCEEPASHSPVSSILTIKSETEERKRPDIEFAATAIKITVHGFISVCRDKVSFSEKTIFLEECNLD